jgi:hypothetical protein
MKKMTIFTIIGLLLFVCILFAFSVSANEQYKVNLSLTQTEQPASLSRALSNTTTFNKNISMDLKIKVPSLNLNGGCDGSKVFNFKDAHIPIKIPLVIEVSNDLKALNVYAKTVEIEFIWDENGTAKDIDK